MKIRESGASVPGHGDNIKRAIATPDDHDGSAKAAPEVPDDSASSKAIGIHAAGRPHITSPLAGNKASWSISLRIVLTMSVITFIGTILLIIGVIWGSRRELSEHDINPNDVNLPAAFHGASVIDSRKALLLIVFFAIGIILAAGAVGWFFSRQEIRPMQEALRLQRNFVADASHELKTPLAVIGARTELLDHRLQQGKALDPVINDLRDDVSRMDSVINDLLLAAQGARQDVPTDVIAAARRAIHSVALLADKAAVRIDFAAPAHPVIVRGGETGIERCIVAVLDNAIAHSPRGSSIDVRVRTMQASEATEAVGPGNARNATSTGDASKAASRGSFTRKERPSNQAEILVRDHGKGIGNDPERLFQRFSRADSGSSHQGYGLGLALARDIAMRYNGWIDVAQTSDQGTTMRIAIPLMNLQVQSPS
ncbi:HAMP domain-containing sensor histidine kinase [Bifidobacterium subtile]|jgi:two-component system OmpR family sensor kinase|uniref:sensor histidine kinase n=1 Tax=Bifidobacterium subtile TaxID=77635 RepID=UPI002F358749